MFLRNFCAAKMIFRIDMTHVRHKYKFTVKRIWPQEMAKQTVDENPTIKGHIIHLFHHALGLSKQADRDIWDK